MIKTSQQNINEQRRSIQQDIIFDLDYSALDAIGENSVNKPVALDPINGDLNEVLPNIRSSRRDYATADEFYSNKKQLYSAPTKTNFVLHEKFTDGKAHVMDRLVTHGRKIVPLRFSKTTNVRAKQDHTVPKNLRKSTPNEEKNLLALT